MTEIFLAAVRRLAGGLRVISCAERASDGLEKDGIKCLISGKLILAEIAVVQPR